MAVSTCAALFFQSKGVAAPVPAPFARPDWFVPSASPTLPVPAVAPAEGEGAAVSTRLPAFMQPARESAAVSSSAQSSVHLESLIFAFLLAPLSCAIGTQINPARAIEGWKNLRTPRAQSSSR